MAEMGVGELNSGSLTDGIAQGHLPPSSIDRAKLTPSPETQPPSDLRLTQAAATAWNFNVETSFPRPYQSSSLDPLTQNVTVSHRRLTAQPCRDQLRESENQPSEPEKDNTLSGIRTETDFTAFASPADNMGAVSRPVLLRSHTVAFGVDTMLPQGNNNNNDDNNDNNNNDNQLMPPPLLQPATFAVPANLRGAASKVQAATERPPPLVSSVGSTTESEPERKVLNQLDTWQRDSLGFCAAPSSDFRSLRRCESLGFDSNCSFGFDNISCSSSSSGTMPSQQLPMPRGEAAATPGGQFIHPADGKDCMSSQGPGGKWRTSRRAWLRHRPLCRGDSRTVTAVSPSCGHGGDRDEPKTAAAEAAFRSGGDVTCGDHYGGRSESHRLDGATATPLPSNHGDKRAVVEGSDTPISNPGCTTKMDASSSSSPASRGTREDCREPCSPRPVPPAFHRQLSRRRSYQQATSPTATCVGDDDNDGDDDDEDPEGRVREEEEEEENSPSYTPPGSPRSKQRRMDMNSIDPYQVFEVQHLPCIILTVKVIRGRNITNGWAQDLIDTPDPYVKLRLKTAPEGRRQTHTVNNDANPVWNETFTFFLGFSETNILEMSLMEANPFNLDSTIGTVYFNVHDRIREFGKRQLEVFNFSGVPETSEIDVEFHMDWDQEPTLRYSLCLSDPEKEFMRKRKHKVWLALNELLGEQGPKTVDETPTIAVIGSGGGFRAMTGYSGVFKALASTGLLDCATYACGLSGSSWYLSTLYSHPRWPDMHPGEMLSELMNNIDKSLAWLLAPSSFFRYLNSVLTKRRQGQPVSFTDFFGHMVGETLLKGRLDSRLTDQREKIKDAVVPMPLYTCVHVKKDVPARSFQEWVEFSPYEIGLPKYGTFMDSELFGSKFFMGKLARKYQEPPLHFLQGIWGSAFCILFKRLLEDNRNLDPAEMIRQEMGIHDDMGQQLEEEQQNNDSSDISDDSDDDLQDSTGESEEEKAGVSKGARSGRRKSSASFLPPALANGTASEDSDRDTSDDGGSSSDPQPPQSFLLLRRQDSSEGFDDVDAPRTPTPMEVGSPARAGKTPSRDREEEDAVSSPDSPRKGVRFSHEVKQFEQRHDKRVQQPQQQHHHHQQQQQARKERPKPALKKANTVRRGKSRSYWSSLLKGIFENQNFELLSTRAGRAAVIHNFMRGLSLQQTYPLSPFTPVNERVQEGDEFDGIFEMYPTHIKHIYMVDAGLTFNSPYPLVLRPQRGVDVILSFDFSARPSDSTPPFKELLLAAKWAKLNRLPFPPIDPSVVDREGLKELYVFQDPDDPNCPVVLHFPLVNIAFRNFSAPGVPRTNQTEMDFADFDLFDDPALPYSTFNFTYTHEQFQRLSQLTEFNTLHSLDEIKRVLAEVVARKKKAAPRVPVHPREFKLLRMKSVQEQRQLKKFLKRMESRGNVIKTPTPTSTSSSSRSSSGSTPPATPFFTPAPRLHSVPERNPFIFHTKSSSSSSSSSSSTDSPQRENPFFNTSRQHSQTKHRNSERPGAPTGSAVRRQATPTPRQESSKHEGFFSASSTPPPSSSSPSSSSSSSRCSSFFPSVSRDSSGDDVFRRGPWQPFSASSQGSPRPGLGRNGHSYRQTSPSVGSVRHGSSASSGTSRQSSGLSRGLSEEDEFHDAVEAFTRDGSPVTNEREAKMHYEGAKERRKLLRRQSTITNLNSITECISLDSAEQDDKLTPALSQTSSNGPERIDVDDLDLFEGTAASASDDDDDSGEENWFDCHNGSSVRHGSVVTLASEGGS